MRNRVEMECGWIDSGADSSAPIDFFMKERIQLLEISIQPWMHPAINGSIHPSRFFGIFRDLQGSVPIFRDFLGIFVVRNIRVGNGRRHRRCLFMALLFNIVDVIDLTPPLRLSFIDYYYSFQFEYPVA